jgi:antagonist of KipI
LKMKSETKIEFLRAGLVTSLQGGNINNLQHLGITTSGPMDYFLSKIGNLIMENNEDDLTFEICKFGPIIKVLEGSFIFLISGNINFKIINNSNSQKGECFKSYILKKGDILEINQTINSNYAYLIFKGELNSNVSSEYRSTIVSSSLGLNDGKKISDFHRFKILNIPSFKNRSLPLSLIEFYDNEIKVTKGPQMNFFKISVIKKFFSKKFKISKNINRVGIRLIENPVRPTISSNIDSDGIIKGSIQVPGDGNPIVLTAEHPTIGGYPKIATVLIADLFKLAQLQEGSKFNFKEVEINVGENLYFDFLKIIKSIPNKIVYL